MSDWTELWKTLFGKAADNLATPPTPPGGVAVGGHLMIEGTFYVAPAPPPGVLESRDLAHCEQELQRRYLAFAAAYKAETGRELYPTCTWRSNEQQFTYFKRGRAEQAPGHWVVVDKGAVITNLDGVTKRGRHNFYPSQAIDVAIDTDPGPGKHLSWDASAYAPFARLATQFGLVWGGDWNGDGRSEDERFVDRPHLELPAGVV